jgi:hypothetical protein
VHSILQGKSNGLNAKLDEALKERLRQTSASGLLTHDNWTKLAVITNENNLTGAKYERDERFGFSGLRGLVDKDLTEGKLTKTRVSGTNTSTANHLSISENLTLSTALRSFELSLVGSGKLSLLVLELLELTQRDAVRRI